MLNLTTNEIARELLERFVLLHTVNDDLADEPWQLNVAMTRAFLRGEPLPTHGNYAQIVTMPANEEWQPQFSSWRHGGWYVDNLSYPSGAVGCVSRNYPDKKWRIACDPRPFETRPTFPNRIAAARGERDLIAALNREAEANQ